MQQINKTEVKYPKGGRVIAILGSNSQLDYSLLWKREQNAFIKNPKAEGITLEITPDNKNMLLCSVEGGFIEYGGLDFHEIKRFATGQQNLLAITKDNNFFYSFCNFNDGFLRKWSLRTKKKIHAWATNLFVWSQKCSYDSKYLFAATKKGELQIVDIKNDQVIATEKLSKFGIIDMSFSRDNSCAYILDYKATIKPIRWKSNAICQKDFDFSGPVLKLDLYAVCVMCLSRDDKCLFVTSGPNVAIINTLKMTVISKHKLMGSSIVSFDQVGDAKEVLISQEDGVQRLCNTENMSLKETHNLYGFDERNKDSYYIRKIAVI